jgi:hypothetical protein
MMNRYLSCTLALVMFSAPVMAGDPSLLSTQDSTKTSLNIHLSGTLTPTSEHPYAGFWKTLCENNFGLAIAAAGPSLYSVSFCGPRGCFRPGTYRPNTSLVSDSDYRIESEHQMQLTRSGTRYSKCWPKP